MLSRSIYSTKMNFMLLTFNVSYSLSGLHEAKHLELALAIATQGQIPNREYTFNYILCILWKHYSRKTIMVANSFEKGKLKCKVKWPSKVGASTMHGP